MYILCVLLFDVNNEYKRDIDWIQIEYNIILYYIIEWLNYNILIFVTLEVYVGINCRL